MTGAPAKIAAIVLAAGRSSRMAPRNKLLEKVGGEPIVVRTVRAALASGAYPVIVVTGFAADRVIETLSGFDLMLVHNPDFDQGLSASLRAGLAAVPPDCDGALILLGDMPFVAAADLKALIASFSARDRRTISIPVREGKRGNPVLWGAAHFAGMMLLSGDEGAKRLIAEHAAHAVEVPVRSDGIFADIDTLDDLAGLKTRA